MKYYRHIDGWYMDEIIAKEYPMYLLDLVPHDIAIDLLRYGYVTVSNPQDYPDKYPPYYFEKKGE